MKKKKRIIILLLSFLIIGVMVLLFFVQRSDRAKVNNHELKEKEELEKQEIIDYQKDESKEKSDITVNKEEHQDSIYNKIPNYDNNQQQQEYSKALKKEIESNSLIEKPKEEQPVIKEIARDPFYAVHQGIVTHTTQQQCDTAGDQAYQKSVEEYYLNVDKGIDDKSKIVTNWHCYEIKYTTGETIGWHLHLNYNN